MAYTVPCLGLPNSPLAALIVHSAQVAAVRHVRASWWDEEAELGDARSLLFEISFGLRLPPETSSYTLEADIRAAVDGEDRRQIDATLVEAKLPGPAHFAVRTPWRSSSRVTGVSIELQRR